MSELLQAIVMPRPQGTISQERTGALLNVTYQYIQELLALGILRTGPNGRGVTLVSIRHYLSTSYAGWLEDRWLYPTVPQMPPTHRS